MTAKTEGDARVSERRGPHGGPLVVIERGGVEISVFETNVPPRFRLYFCRAAIARSRPGRR
jgi:hypothetical protein